MSQKVVPEIDVPVKTVKTELPSWMHGMSADDFVKVMKDNSDKILSALSQKQKQALFKLLPRASTVAPFNGLAN